MNCCCTGSNSVLVFDVFFVYCISMWGKFGRIYCASGKLYVFVQYFTCCLDLIEYLNPQHIHSMQIVDLLEFIYISFSLYLAHSITPFVVHRYTIHKQGVSVNVVNADDFLPKLYYRSEENPQKQLKYKKEYIISRNMAIELSKFQHIFCEMSLSPFSMARLPQRLQPEVQIYHCPLSGYLTSQQYWKPHTLLFFSTSI